MRRLWLNLSAVALLTPMPAPAQTPMAAHVVTDPHWLEPPGAVDMTKYYPAAAVHQAGVVKLQCLVTIAAKLEKCTVLSESPEGLGFGAAAISMSAVFRMQPRTVDGVAVGGAAVTIPVHFSPPVDPYAGHVVTNPHWVKQPTAEDMANFWPANGLHEGSVKIGCTVTGRGTLAQCKVLSETPPGAGFGGAALLMTPLFVMEPKTVDGTPVGGATVIIPVRFFGGDRINSPAAHIKVADSLAWSAAPTASELAAAFPKYAIGRALKARVVLRCAVGRDGGVHDCETMTEQPGGLGFSRAAHELAKRFRIYDDHGYADRLRNTYVDIPFDFHDPNKTGPAVSLIDPVWLVTANPLEAGKVFPLAAAAAGLKTGRALLSCKAAHDGSLTDCAVVNETPPGLGFGQAATAIAGVMKMNLWSRQGFPVDGATIQLPIRVNLNEPSPTALPQP